VVIKTEFPLGTIIRNKYANGRITKWAMELCPFDLEFTRRDTIKSQTLADFMVEWTDLSITTSQGRVDYWKMYFDGSLTIDGAGAGILFISPTNEQLCYSSGFTSQHLTMLQNTRHVFMVCTLQLTSVSSAFTSTVTWPSY
jgi:hypothetical protein